jgi:selenide,water dikinase
MKREKTGGLLAGLDEQMQCGGCGSKVAADLLGEVLSELDIDDAQLDDAATFEVPEGKIMLHTVDAFRSFLADPWIFSRITVNHALSDIYAMGGTPVTALAVITLPYAAPGKTRELLRQVLDGASSQLDADDVRLVGGHTSEGPELNVGFAVNGLGNRERLTRRDKLEVGDALILTRALGTGALFAADMQAKARGEWIEHAIEQMLQSNRAAAELLLAKGVTAMTDVTGFGLAGHLARLLEASGVGSRLALDAMPVLPGVLDVLGEGITSTLHEGNRRSATGIRPHTHPKFEVLFDPQTAGGLLAAVPSSFAGETIDALHAAGYADASQIGFVIEAGQPEISVD